MRKAQVPDENAAALRTGYKGVYICPEAWYLARRGVRQEVHASFRVERGVHAHKRIGAETDRLQRLDRTRRLVVILIVVLVVAAAAQLIGAAKPL